MSEETKQDVFDDLLEKYQHHIITVLGDYGNKDKAVEVWSKRYEAALPDNLPVIPKVWGDTIEECKTNHFPLSDTFTDWDWHYDEQELIARAWLLGAWRVKGTGEIVKLEAEK